MDAHPLPYEQPVAFTDIATGILARNPSEMTFEGTNSFILKAPGSSTCVLVDPGPHLEEHHDALVKAAGEIELIIITHRHPDHTDGLQHILTTTGAPSRAYTQQWCSAGQKPFTDGELIHAGGLQLQVLHTPGHTADSICVLVQGEASEPVLVLGDTILGRESTVLDSTDGTLRDYLSSMKTLQVLAEAFDEPLKGLPGHGPLVQDVAQHATDLAAHRLDRVQQIREAIVTLGLSGPHQEHVVAITEHIYQGYPEFLQLVARGSTSAALQYLHEEHV